MTDSPCSCEQAQSLTAQLEAARQEVAEREADDAATVVRLQEGIEAVRQARNERDDYKRHFEACEAARVKLLAEVAVLTWRLEKACGRRFPVLDGGPGCPSSVPWVALYHYEGQALKNHEQTLERLAERGGLSPEEIVAVLEGRSYRDVRQMDHAWAVKRMVELTDAALREASRCPAGDGGGEVSGESKKGEDQQKWPVQCGCVGNSAENCSLHVHARCQRCGKAKDVNTPDPCYCP